MTLRCEDKVVLVLVGVRLLIFSLRLGRHREVACMKFQVRTKAAGREAVIT
jgi:hypothetical protein